MFLILPEHYGALREEATRRAVKDGGRSDASAVLRELLDQWMKSKPKKP